MQYSKQQKKLSVLVEVLAAVFSSHDRGFSQVLGGYELSDLCAVAEEEEGNVLVISRAQASLLTHKANYLLQTILQDASAHRCKAGDHAAHLHSSSLSTWPFPGALPVCVTDGVCGNQCCSSPLPLGTFIYITMPVSALTECGKNCFSEIGAI